MLLSKVLGTLYLVLCTNLLLDTLKNIERRTLIFECRIKDS